MNDALGLEALQARVRAFDEARGWHDVDAAHTALHLLEELGEVAREILRLKSYKDPGDGAHRRLHEELADVTVLVAKLANTVNADLETGVRALLARNEARFPVDASRDAMSAYRAANPDAPGGDDA